jgi:hypothetical protein
MLGLLCVALAVGRVILSALNGVGPVALLIDGQGLNTVTLVISFGLVGALIVARRPGNSIGWLFCAAGVFQGVAYVSEEYGTYTFVTAPGALPFGAEILWLSYWTWVPGLAAILIFVPLLFPTGWPPSRLWYAVAWIGGFPAALLLLTGAIGYWPLRGPGMLQPMQLPTPPLPQWLNALLEVSFPLLLIAGLFAVVSLLVRYWNARAFERQQIKWGAFAAALTLVGFVLAEVVVVDNTDLDTLLTLLSVLILPSTPVAVAVAILRHRLYDIDVIINRALVYGLLTALLAAVYFGGVALLQWGLRLLTGQQASQLAVVASTLAIAALFQPLRRRLQGAIDHRFYRRKYDAALVVAAFGATLRGETDLERLSAHLVAAVDETMQPTHVSLWLRPRAESRRR